MKKENYSKTQKAKNTQKAKKPKQFSKEFRELAKLKSLADEFSKPPGKWQVSTPNQYTGDVIIVIDNNRENSDQFDEETEREVAPRKSRLYNFCHSEHVLVIFGVILAILGDHIYSRYIGPINSEPNVPTFSVEYDKKPETKDH